MLFSPAILANTAEDQIYDRGIAYFLDGHVQGIDIQKKPHGRLVIKGQVTGTDDYETSLTIDPTKTKVIFYDCTCPYDWGMCKHAVSLGLAALAKEAGLGSVAKDKDYVEFLQEISRSVSEEVDSDELLIAAKKLKQKLMAKSSEKVFRVARRHYFDAVRVYATYDKKTDEVLIRPVAVYGPYEVNLVDPNAEEVVEEKTKGKTIVHSIEREWGQEEDAQHEIARQLALIGVIAEGPFRVSSKNLYDCVTQVLPEIEMQYELVADEEVKKLMDVEEAELDADFETAVPSGVDWFEFSVQWHCAQTKLKLDDLERLTHSAKPYVRTKEGRFIQVKNLGDAQPILDILHHAKKQKGEKFETKRFFAPELFRLIRNLRQDRSLETSSAFERLLTETKQGRPVEPVLAPPHLDVCLRPYQKDGLAWLEFLYRNYFSGVLADDMGLGKTLQVLAFLSLHHEDLKKQPALIVCPKTLLLNWQLEAKKFTPELRTLVIDGTPGEREKKIAIMREYDVVITSYSLLQRDLQSYAKVSEPFFACMLDEAQHIKNARTAVAESVKAIPARFRLALTGTPLENGVHELWSIFDFLLPGYLGDAKSFTTDYVKPIRDHQDESKLKQLRAKAQPFLLRRTKQGLLHDLPPKIEQVSMATLTPEQLVVYNRTLEDVKRRILEAVEEKGFKRARVDILAALSHLRRICDHPSLVDDRLPKEARLSGKMELALELIRDAVEGQHQVLVFSQYTSMLDLLRDSLDQEQIQSCTIEGKTKDRQGEVDRFAKDKVPVFLLSLRAGGTGLTLTSADTVIMYDPWWNPQVERQAMDRAHRIGQTKTVNVYKLVTKGTIEEKVVELQEKKQHIFDALMSDTPTSLEALTWEDVQRLIET